jgi:CO/xanthine dehydrogenase FAD-binding subunit
MCVGKTMTMEYHRPRSIEEALTLLKQGQLLAGGTSLAPRIRALSSVVDLQDLGLDALDITDTKVIAGACITLQSLAEIEDPDLDVLARASRLEAGWNLRNAATLAGTLISADGRSPLVTALLALDTRIDLQPGSENIDLDELLDRRDRQEMDRLMTAISILRPRWLVYEQVARSPADRPIVCAAAAEIVPEGGAAQLRVALGGFGARPILVATIDAQPGLEGTAEELGRLASDSYSQADDVWASAEYRSEIASVLVRRLIREGAAP